MLSVRRGAKAIEFYKTAFGADELFRLDSEDGAVVARLSVGPAEFWVADESPEHLGFRRRFGQIKKGARSRPSSLPIPQSIFASST
jgi:uncharacterized glyoxalase superfamily protein PhnB